MALNALFEHNASFYTDSLVSPADVSGRNIRLLHIQPGGFDDPFACDLSTVELNEQVAYTALSYVWGIHEVPQKIQINGKSDFWVTQNAFAAMRRLRQHNKEGLTVWIDAICIKQTDIEERNTQVSMMGKIYQNARTVFVYLGRCSGQPEGEPELESCARQSLHADVAMIEKTTNPDDDAGGILQNDDDGEEDSGPYQWWQRCWTFQETLLAREIVFLFGTHRYTLSQLCQLAALGCLPTRLCLTLSDLNGEGIFGELRPEHRDSDDEDSNFFGLLMAVAARHATEPRDKVYSVLGLNLPNQPTIAVDYSKPIETVAYETTMALLEAEDKTEWGEKFYIMHNVFGFAYRNPWISWVPDFCSPGLLRQGELFDAIGEDGAKQRYGRKASKQDRKRFSITAQTLHTQGLEFDTIAFKLEHNTIPPEQNNFKRLSRAQWVAQHIQNHLSHHDDTSNLTKHRHKRELAIQNKHKDTPEWRAIKSQRTTMDKLTHRLSYAGIMQQRSKRQEINNAKQDKHLGYRVLHALSGKETTHASLDWQIITDMIKPGTCFFVTEGGYIGFATPVVQLGDVVAVVFNFPEVMVLRRTALNEEGTYRMVSEALVPSIQDGQLVQLYEKGKMQVKDFKLV